MIRRTYYLLDMTHPAFSRDLGALQRAYERDHPGWAMPAIPNGTRMMVTASRVAAVSGHPLRALCFWKPRYPGSALVVSDRPVSA